jgi:NAD(P)H-dependent FMN reductase
MASEQSPASYLVFSCSLNPESRSRGLAERVHAHLAQGVAAEFVDLARVPLPMCDGAFSYGDANVKMLQAKIAAARGIVVATAIYNYDVNAAAKNLLELTGRAWTGKVVGFICAAGGQGSYMSVMPFANSLMLDFRCHVVPRFVYSVDADPGHEDFGSEATERRIAELADEMIRVTEALRPE